MWDAAQEGAELLREGWPDDAIAELEELLRANEHNYYGYYFLANAYFEKRDFERALKGYLSAVEKRPDYLGALVGAGHTLRMMGRWKQALQLAQEVLRRKDDDQDGLYLAGLIYFQNGDHEEAKGLLEKFLETGPELEVKFEVEGLLQVIAGDVAPLPDEAMSYEHGGLPTSDEEPS